MESTCRRLVLALGASALLVFVALPGVALAASKGPSLVSPTNGMEVQREHFNLVVRDTAVPRGRSVWAWISPTRTLNAFGHLGGCNTTATLPFCGYVRLKRWHGHPGLWIYTPPTNPRDFFWANFTRRFYWQAFHINCSVTTKDRCHVTSRISSFRVV